MEKIYLTNIDKISQIFLISNIFFLLTIINPIIAETIFNKNRKLQTKLSMNLKVTGYMYIKIINENYYYPPDRIYINGNETTIDQDGYIDIYNEDDDYYNYDQIYDVKIEWNTKITIFESLFQDCNVVEVDLSNFDTSGLVSMKNMFLNCYSLKIVNFEGIDTSLVTTMESLFEYCFSLESLDLSAFVTTKVKNMDRMFNYCMDLTSLDIINFETKNVESMEEIFASCISLKSIDLSKMDTSSVTNMNSMFYGCSSLKTIDLSKMDTSNVINMNSMFYGCSSLISIDLSNFHLAENINAFFSFCSSLESIKFSSEMKYVSNINNIFSSCSSLKSIDLSSFNLSEINGMDYLFSECNSLTYLDLSNIHILSPISMAYTFYKCISLKEINFTNFKVSPISINNIFFECISLKSLDLNGFDTSSTINMEYAFFNCENLTSLNLSNFNTSLVTSMQSMFSKCSSLISLDLSNFETSNVFFMSYMFEECSELRSLDLSNFDTQNANNLNSMFSKCVNLKFINFYNYKFIDKTPIGNIFFSTPEILIICIKENSSQFSHLYSKNCIINDCSKSINYNKKLIHDNKKCIDDCMDDEIYKYNYDIYCYDTCPIGTHSNKENKYLCEKNEYKCFEDHPFLLIEYNICRDKCNIKDFFDGLCTLNVINDNTESLLIESIIKGIQEGLMDNLIKEVINKEKNDIVKKDYDITYQITSTFNQNNTEYQNLSTIALGELENIIKEEYNISLNEDLIIFKKEKYIEGVLIPLIEYEIFNPETKEKIDLNNYKNNNLNIIINIPISIKENNLYKYDPNNRYYNDICYIYTTDRGTDFTLFDRKNEFNINNYSLCFKNCIYNGYDSVKKKVICECKIERLSGNGDNFLYKFLISKRLTNFSIIKCYKKLFTIEEIFTNVANYIILLIIILFIISAIYFYAKGYDIICSEINEILEKKYLESKYNINQEKDINKENTINNAFSSIKNLDIKKISNKSIYNNLTNNIDSKIELENNKIKVKIKNKFNKQEIKNNNKNEKINEYMELDINSFNFKDALKNDNRNYFQFYISLIMEKHILLFTFNMKKDYNIFCVKICFLFFAFSIFIIVNTFFFNDSTFHRIYLDYGKFNFFYVLPHIIYSILITSIINEIIKKLSVSRPNIFQIKNEKNEFNLEAKVLIELRCIIIKFTCFFLIGILFLILFWYYLSCFFAIYKNTQIYLFKTILIGYILSLIYPFIYFLIPGLLRIPAIKGGPGKFCYIISKLIPLL